LSWALTALTCFTWLLYGVRTSEIPQIPGNVFMVSGAVAVVLAVPSRHSVGRRAAATVSAALVLAVLAFVLPTALAGSVAFAVGVVSGLPQLAVSLTRRSGASANSLLTWMLRVASQACWLFYAVVVGDVVVTVSASFLCLSAALVVGAELVRHPAPAEPPAPAPRLQLPSVTG
jgi:uncharacterized protein with PQ loop repeat